MNAPTTSAQSRAAFAIAVALTLLSACGAMTEKSAARTGGSAVAPSESGFGAYLETMQKLATSDPAQQADVFYDVERAYTGAPTTANTLRHAVALVTPGHPASNLVEGKKALEKLLANPERLTPTERNLASFLVKDADSRLQMQAEIRRLTATVDERTRTQANSDRRAQSQLEEIAKLKRALEEAQRKLDAVKSIERSIIERSATPPPRDSNTRD